MRSINEKMVMFDIRNAEKFFGRNNVFWSKNLEWIMLKNFKLPRIYNQRYTDCIVVIPDGYGYGKGLEEFYLNQGLKVMKDGRWVSMEDSSLHLYGKSSGLNKYGDKGWTWMCIHPQWENGDNLLTFLKQVELFLKFPFREHLI